MNGERGFTLVELIVTMTVGLVVVLGAFALVDMVTRDSARTQARVQANQLARPVLQRLADELHSTCMGPNAAPVLAGSGDNSITFLHRVGSSVSPTPDKRTVTLTGTTLAESIYPATGGSLPNWTFAPTPSSTRELLVRVGPGKVGSPSVNVPLFRYYASVNGQLSSTPLPTPLSAADAGRAVQVVVAFSVAPATTTTTPDPKAAVSVSDGIYLRFSPFSEDPTKVNGPCA